MSRSCRALFTALGLVCAALAASCGGGGGSSGGGELSGSVTLNASAEVATPMSISATLPPGASGQPSCVLNAGQVPPGTVLSGCTLQGTPTAVGAFQSELTMTLPGYTGSTKVNATVTIVGPYLANFAPAGTGLPLNVPISGLALFSGVYTTAPFVVRPTDLISYRVVSGALPQGLSFDPATGLISGTPRQAGNYPLTIGATLTRGSATYEMPPFVTAGVTVLGS